MAQIRNVGPGIRTTGQSAGLVYVHVKGKTYTRALPIMPSGMFRTPEARKRQALFTLVSWHMKTHAATIGRSFSRGKYWSPRNNYFHHNAKALYAALDALADSYVAGEVVTVAQIEQAVASYATDHPGTIQIGGLDGFSPVYLAGAWPDTITLSSLNGDNTTVVIVTSAGTTSFAPGASNPGNQPAPEMATIVLRSVPEGAIGQVSGGGEKEVGSQASLSATSTSSYHFIRWEQQGGSTYNTASIEVTVPAGGATYTAYFEEL